jgi:hypothetical protein
MLGRVFLGKNTSLQTTAEFKRKIFNDFALNVSRLQFNIIIFLLFLMVVFLRSTLRGTRTDIKK